MSKDRTIDSEFLKGINGGLDFFEMVNSLGVSLDILLQLYKKHSVDITTNLKEDIIKSKNINGIVSYLSTSLLLGTLQDLIIVRPIEDRDRISVLNKMLTLISDK